MRRELLDQLNGALAKKQPVVLITRLQDGEQYLYDANGNNDSCPFPAAVLDLAQQTLVTDRAQLDEEGDVFLQPFNPALRMIVVGAVHIAQALVPMANMAGYEVTVVDPRQTFASDARFPDVSIRTDWPDVALRELAPDSRTAIVTLTHDPKLDDPALEVALESSAFYIGSLGSKKTQQGRYERLLEKGFKEEQARIHGPIGLDIGAKSPAEIAVSILAEITESLRKS